MKNEELYPVYWPEMCEHSPAYSNQVVPPWSTLEAQAIASRLALIKNRNEGNPGPELGIHNPHRRSFGTVRTGPIPYEDFDINNIHCFQYLPVVWQARERMVSALTRSLRHVKDPIDLESTAQQFRQELAHSVYHHAMWRRHGRRVYVLDQITYNLLAQTPLPKLPASILAIPDHSFYLKFPRNAFDFGVWNQWTKAEGRQEIEGVMISIDNLDPDSPKQREIAFLVVGKGGDVDDRNIAYINMSIGPDASLDDIRIHNASATGIVSSSIHHEENLIRDTRGTGFANQLNSGAYELGVITPRVILGFLLYLQSEHPDIEPVPPAPRRAFHDVRSPKERARALENQELRLRGTTRLPILYVGRHLAQEIADEVSLATVGHLDFNHTTSAESVKQWTLDHQVWVRGHWKRQPFGEGRKERRMIWIRPYIKGPELLEVLKKVHAAKVQRAQAASEKPDVDVTPLPVPKLHRQRLTGTDE